MRAARLVVILLLTCGLVPAISAAQTPLMRDEGDARMPADAPLSMNAASMVPSTGDYRIDSLLGPCQWTPGSTISYSFYSDAVFAGSYYGTESVSEVSEGVKTNVRAIMPMLGTLMNLTFVEVPESSTTIGRIRFMRSPSPAYAYTYYPCSTATFNTSGDVLLNPAYDRMGDTNGFQNTAGYHGYTTLIHEIGHALGLKHPHDTGGSGVTLPTLEDSHTQTVMSYNFYGNSPATPMGYDLLAFHYIYGARAKYPGASTYRFVRTALDQFVVDNTLVVSPSGATKQAIWDSSGPNTLDFASITTPASGGYRIDTRPLGYISASTAYVQSPLYLQSGTVVGPNVTIATVIGSPGNDTIYANSAPNTFGGYTPSAQNGNDLIVGAASDDVVDLTAFLPNGVVETAVGNDLVVAFNGGRGSVRIQDYYLAHPTVRYKSVVTVDGVTPFAGSGVAQTFTVRVSDSNGTGQLQSAWVWFAADQSSTAHSCLVSYDTTAQQIRVLDDAGQLWIGGSPGAGGSIQNAQCAVTLASVSISTSGNTLTMAVPVTFASGYAGIKNIYGFGSSKTVASSGWQDVGDWTVSNPATIAVDTVSPASGTGASQAFALQYSDSLGGADLATAWVWFTPAIGGSAANSCLLYYTRATNTLSLLNDAGADWVSATAGNGGTLQNAQCAIALGTASTTVSGTHLTLNVSMTFKAAFAGAKNVFLYAANIGGNSGWQDRGDWTVPAPPVATVSATSSTPANGSGASQTFSLLYSSTAGADDLATAWAWFTNSTASAQTSCLVWLDRSAGVVRLLDDAGSTWMPAAVGGASTLQNGQCSVNVAGLAVVTNGNTLTWSLPVSFTGSFAGTKNVYLYATNAAGQNSGWQDRGDWTVPPGAITGSSIAPSSGQGMTQTFAMRYVDSSGGSDLRTAWTWFTTTTAGTADHSCLIYYTPQTNTLFLLDDTAVQWLPATLGSSTVLQNSQCAISAGSSSASVGATDLTLTLAMTFQRSFSGGKNAYLYATGVSGATPAWTQVGTWTIPAGSVAANSATPNSGNSNAQSFALAYSDADGFSDIASTWMWLTTDVNGGAAGSCLLYVDRAARTINLLNDAGTGWLTGALGTAATVQNGQCAIDLGTSDLVGNGTTLDVTLAMTFSQTFSGVRRIYLYAAGGGTSSGWQDRGSWTVP